MKLVSLVLMVGLRAAQGDDTHADAPPDETHHDEGDLANKVQNPVSNLISVPFQENLDYGIGPFSRARSTLNIQPVLPLHVTEHWNLITRTIVPIIYQPILTGPEGGSSGLGDINPTVFLSPAKPGKLIWGIGPTGLLPTASQTSLGNGKWAFGPSVVVLVQPHPWTIGALVNNLLSVAGEDNRPAINAMTLQYFVNYNLPGAWYLASQPIITANWNAASGERWLVPFGAGFGKIFRLGKLPLNGQVTGYYNAVRPEQTPSPQWQMRIQLAMLFPK